MAVNKVVYGGNTVIDISDSTVTPETLGEGATAYSAAGELIEGQAAIGGVTSFNGRTGEVAPASGDYTAEMVGAQPLPDKIILSGDISIYLADNTEYLFTEVDSFYLIRPEIGFEELKCHGFIRFAAAAPTINLVGFSGYGGDDVFQALAGEVWEFSVASGPISYDTSSEVGLYIIFKKWSE